MRLSFLLISLALFFASEAQASCVSRGASYCCAPPGGPVVCERFDWDDETRAAWELEVGFFGASVSRPSDYEAFGELQLRFHRALGFSSWRRGRTPARRAWVGDDIGFELRGGFGKVDGPTAGTFSIAPRFDVRVGFVRFPAAFGVLLPEVGLVAGEPGRAVRVRWPRAPVGFLVHPRLSIEVEVAGTYTWWEDGLEGWGFSARVGLVVRPPRLG